MIQNHTPGPWENLSHSTGRQHDGHIIAARGNLIARIWHTEDDLQSASNIRETQDANARLIAAAPDMLDALEVVLEAEQHYKQVMDTHYETAEERRRERARAIARRVIAFERVSAALAKAKGE